MHNVCKDKETNSSFTIIEKNETYKQKRSIYSSANKIDCFDILDVNKSYCKGVVSVTGSQVTSCQPCWWPKTKTILSSGNSTLFSCKFFEILYWPQWPGALNGKFWEKDLNTTIKHEQSFLKSLKAFWEIAGKMIYLFLTPGKTDGRVPSQQGAPTTCNLTYWDVFPAIVCLDVTGQFGYGHREKLSPSVTNSTYQLFETPKNQIPSDTLNCLFPSNTFTFLPRTYYFFQISQPAKNCLKNRC